MAGLLVSLERTRHFAKQFKKKHKYAEIGSDVNRESNKSIDPSIESSKLFVTTNAGNSLINYLHMSFVFQDFCAYKLCQTYILMIHCALTEHSNPQKEKASDAAQKKSKATSL